MSETVAVFPLMITYSGVNCPSAISTPSFRVGRSRMWPTVAFTEYFDPRYFPIVFALVGDSTMTRAVPLRTGASALAARRAPFARAGLAALAGFTDLAGLADFEVFVALAVREPAAFPALVFLVVAICSA